MRDAIAAGIINDMGSGSSIDLAVIKPNDNIDYIRPYEKLIPKGERKGNLISIMFYVIQGVYFWQLLVYMSVVKVVEFQSETVEIL